MSEPLPLFDDEEPSIRAQKSKSTITRSQRDALRKLFQELGVTVAREQFAVVEEITGQRITAVNDLLASGAQVLIYQLPARIRSQARIVTGNDWADREEDTWIDKL
jgi:DNA polymerase-3 subunit epsilon